MSTVFNKYSTNVRIGELLVQAGMLSPEQLKEAVKHGGGKRLQLGQILVMYGYLSARDLQIALDAQSMIRDKSLEIDLALKYLKIAYKTGASFVDVLSDHDRLEIRKRPTGKLGELLLESGLISSEQFSSAMQRSLITGLPLGRMLVLNDVISDSLLNEALEIQVRLRDEMVGRDEVLKALRAAAGLTEPHLPVPQTAPPTAVRKRGIRLGELLVLGGVLSETDIMNALEWGLLKDKPIGQVLMAKKLVTRELIEAALFLQSEVDNKSLDAAQASEVLARVHSSGCSVTQALGELTVDSGPKEPQLTYDKFLTLCGVVADEDIEAAFDASSKSAQIIARVLHVTGYIDEPKMRATLRCYQMYSRGWLSQDDALASLRYCLTHKTDAEGSFDDVLRELGWKLKEPLQLGEDSRKSLTDITSEAPVDSANHSKNAPESRMRFAETIQPEDPRAQQLAKLAAHSASKYTGVNASLVESFGQLAKSYAEQGSYVEAQQIYERILVLKLNELGPSHPQLSRHFISLAGVLCTQGKFNQAEPFMRRLVTIYDSAENPDPLKLVDALNILSRIYFRQDKYWECEPVLKRALELREKYSGPSHPITIETLADYARLLRKTNRPDEAENIYKQVRQRRSTNDGPPGRAENLEAHVESVVDRSEKK